METTWSGTPDSLMRSLAAHPDVDLVRADAQHRPTTAAALIALGRLRGYGDWKHSRLSRRLTDARVRRRTRVLPSDAVIAVADVETITSAPTFFYQDANFSVIRAHQELLREHVPILTRFPRGRLDELVSEQQAAYRRSAGVLAFSRWFADWLVRVDGVPADKVHVIGGGLHEMPPLRPRRPRPGGQTRVLFVGRDFFRKGGDLVVDAVAKLRESGSGDFTLTIVGPVEWPLPTPPPAWVDFRGELPATLTRGLWADHDVFAMPTWYEPYGLVFLEARASGLPSLGRRAFCMPELVPPTAGRLIGPTGGSDDVADALAAIAQDGDLFDSVAAEAEATRAEHSWAAVAERAVTSLRAAVTS